MDYLLIKDAKCSCNIGITPKERSGKQPVLVDCRLGINTSVSAKSGKIEHTVDYAMVCDEIIGIAQGKPWVLLETLAEELANRIMRTHGAKEITIRVKKPRALKGKAAYGGIEIRRIRDG